MRVCFCGYDFMPTTHSAHVQTITPAPPGSFATEIKSSMAAKVGAGCIVGTFMGVILITIGSLLCITLVGAIIGVPMILTGIVSFAAGPLIGAKARL